MRMTFRLLAVAGAAVASLALASGALATQRLIVSASTIQVTEDKSDAAPLKITIYIATGFSATLGQAAGTQIGAVHADLQALAISPDAIIPADGTVLADDPGSAVLTVTSLGMVARSSMPAELQNREVALWKEPNGKAQALKLPKDDHALLLTLTSRLVEQVTLDGRGDGGATVHFGLGAAHGVRHPCPPAWLGRIP